MLMKVGIHGNNGKEKTISKMFVFGLSNGWTNFDESVTGRKLML